MKKNMFVTCVATAVFVLSFLLVGVGCDRQVSKTESSNVSRDGSVKTQEKTVTKAPDGSVTKKQESTTTAPNN